VHIGDGRSEAWLRAPFRCYGRKADVSRHCVCVFVCELSVANAVAQTQPLTLLFAESCNVNETIRLRSLALSVCLSVCLSVLQPLLGKCLFFLRMTDKAITTANVQQVSREPARPLTLSACKSISQPQSIFHIVHVVHVRHI